MTAALWGARHPEQLEPVDQVMGWSLSGDAMHEIDRILNTTVTDPVGPEFMAPPPRPQTALAYDSPLVHPQG